MTEAQCFRLLNVLNYMKIGLRQYYGHALKDDYYGNILIIKYESVAAFLAAKKCLDIVPFEDVFY